jgi:hypothetical protein
MSHITSFSFQEDNILQAIVHEGVFLRIERLGSSLARIFFVNEQQMEIPIPQGFRILDNSNENVNIQKLKGRQDYVLCCTDNYSLYRNDVLILKLASQRKWAIQTTRQLTVITSGK